MTTPAHMADPGDRDCSVGMLTANLLTVAVSAPAVVALGAAYSLRWGAASLVHGIYGLLDPIILAIGILPGILAHELIHAIAWARAARRPLSAIELGIRWRSLAPYAHPRDPITVEAYRFGAAMPMLLLGLAPAFAATVTGAPRLMAWGLFFVFTAGGDMLLLWLIRKVPDGSTVEDHPSRVGCRVRAQAPSTL